MLGELASPLRVTMSHVVGDVSDLDAPHLPLLAVVRGWCLVFASTRPDRQTDRQTARQTARQPDQQTD
eukprot:669603-Rhodomonas_salina.1